MEEMFKMKRFYLKNEFLDYHYNIIALLAAQHKVDEQFLYNKLDDIFSHWNRMNSMNTPKVPAIGIDLGTHNSYVSFYDPDYGSKVIRNEMGKDVTPSVVSFRKNNEVIVGQVAKEELFQYKESTIHSLKRLIGQTFEDLNTNQKFIRNLDYNLININNQPTISIDIAPGVLQKYITQEISAKLLEQLKYVAQKYLGFEVKKVVIAVPAYFNESQKEATKEAGRLAGLEVLALIPEPIAAAIAFDFEKNKEFDRKKILIYDFGAGTLDITIVRLEKNKIINEAMIGDYYLGGKDIDNNLIKYCVGEFKKHPLCGFKSNYNGMKLNELRKMCEQAKIKLTSRENTTILIRNFHQDANLKVELTQKKFAEINNEIFDRTINLVKVLLKDVNLKIEDIDEIVVGSTRIPQLQHKLSKLFNNRPLGHRINPNHSVAIGAAIAATRIANSE